MSKIELIKRFRANIDTKAIWVWQADTILQADFISNLVFEKITLVFIPYSSKAVSNEKYQEFITNCHNSHIDVFALHGESDWVTSNAATSFTRINDVINFNAISPRAKFDGIHLDVEPQSLTEWKTGDRAKIIRDWINLSEQWIELAHMNNLEIGASFPYWINNQVSSPTPDGRELDETMLEMYDHYAIMAYSTDYLKTVEWSKRVVSLNAARKVFPSLEVSFQAGNISLFYNDFFEIERMIAAIDQHFNNEEGYSGVAIHDYNEYARRIRQYRLKKI
ncbi:hypothetical protein HCA69_02360 [Listeria grandensis]|uniref:Uncharacterized protein n=1 Tax=Listeria grandensis TaxID=1494963 RepID=A0A7X0Y1V8_9LIST|nr:hypothetical protein [Listeria grandensis]MBC1935193.1 hypothetical protein [Listeria grandensis]